MSVIYSLCVGFDVDVACGICNCIVVLLLGMAPGWDKSRWQASCAGVDTCWSFSCYVLYMRVTYAQVT